MEWINLLQNLGIFSIIITGASWVIKKYFEKIFDKDLEKFKADLEKQSTGFRIRYEKMHSERAEVVKVLYKKIVRTYRAFHSYMNVFQGASEPPQEEKGKEASKCANDFTDYYKENRIFIDENLAKEIDKLSDAFKKAWVEFEISRFNKTNRPSYVENWSNAWKIISEETPVVKNKIENEFRKILGINYEN